MDTAVLGPRACGTATRNSNRRFSPWSTASLFFKYHLVLVTDFRIPIFDEVIAPKLFDYVIAIGEKRGFAVDRVTVLPDHVHLLIEAVPSLTIGDCALSLMNNTRHWMENKYWGVLKQANAWDVWRPSFYAGTVGEYTTA